MIYRAQFCYATPPGCRDEDFVYYFDGSNTPMLDQNVSGLALSHIPLPLEQDAPFYWRGIKVELRAVGGGPSPSIPDMYVKFRDCYLNFLSDGLVSAVTYGFAQNPVTFNNADYTGAPVPLEPEIYCPAGGLIEFFLQAPVSWQAIYPLVTLFGVKRFKDCGGRS
jgi:hypothetical protein